jgi:hypothetical protein
MLAIARSRTTLISLRIGGRVNHSVKHSYLHGRAQTVSG